MIEERIKFPTESEGRSFYSGESLIKCPRCKNRRFEMLNGDNVLRCECCYVKFHEDSNNMYFVYEFVRAFLEWQVVDNGCMEDHCSKYSVIDAIDYEFKYLSDDQVASLHERIKASDEGKSIWITYVKMKNTHQATESLARIFYLLEKPGETEHTDESCKLKDENLWAARMSFTENGYEQNELTDDIAVDFLSDELYDAVCYGVFDHHCPGAEVDIASIMSVLEEFLLLEKNSWQRFVTVTAINNCIDELDDDDFAGIDCFTPEFMRRLMEVEQDQGVKAKIAMEAIRRSQRKYQDQDSILQK